MGNEIKNKKLKIAFLSLFSGGVNRGGETFVAELSKRLSVNHAVTVIAGNSKALPSWPILWRFFLDPQGIGVLKFALKNFSRLIREKYDVVVAMDGGFEAILARLATWLYGGKLIISGQSGKGWFDRINILSSPDAFVAISSYSLRKLRWMNPFIKYSYIPNGVDLTKFKPTGETYNLKLRKPIILTVGALVKSKRINLVIEAVSRLNEANLLIVGDGEESSVLESLAKRLIPGRFEFLSVKHEDIPEIYRAADLFVLLPRSSEAFGIVYVEAMASGLPVVAVNDDQRREIIGSGGILIDHADEPEDVAFAINDALKRKWDNKPRTQAKKFSWDEITRRYEKLMLELIK